MTPKQETAMQVLLNTPAGDASVEVVMPQATSDYASAVDELTSNWTVLRDQLERPLFAYYWHTLVGSTESGPQIPTRNEIWKYVEIGEITPELSHSGDRYVRITGGCSWEEEHGLEIQVRNGTEIVYCGMFHGRVLESPCKDSWNFAVPENQVAALEQEFVSEDELEEIAVEAGTSVDTAASKKTNLDVQARPWWKLW